MSTKYLVMVHCEPQPAGSPLSVSGCGGSRVQSRGRFLRTPAWRRRNARAHISTHRWWHGPCRHTGRRGHHSVTRRRSNTTQHHRPSPPRHPLIKPARPPRSEPPSRPQPPPTSPQRPPNGCRAPPSDHRAITRRRQRSLALSKTAVASHHPPPPCRPAIPHYLTAQWAVLPLYRRLHGQPSCHKPPPPRQPATQATAT